LAQPPQGEGVSSASRQINMAHDTGLHFISFHISHFPTHKTTHPEKKGVADSRGKAKPAKWQLANWQQSGGAETAKFSSAARQQLF